MNKEIDVKTIKAGSNRVVVRLNPLNDSVKFEDGTKLYLETKYTPAEHTQVIGTVVGLPDKLVFNRKNMAASMEGKTDMELQKEDTVVMEYFAVMMALADKYDQAASYPDPTWFEQDNHLYIIIPYADIYFRIRDNQITPINGYCIAKSITLDEPKSSLILIPDTLKNRKSARWAEITHVGSPCTDFIDKKYKDKGDISVGDCVLIKNWSNQRIEYCLHNTLFDKSQEHVVIQRKWMSASVPIRYRESIEMGVLK